MKEKDFSLVVIKFNSFKKDRYNILVSGETLIQNQQEDDAFSKAEQIQRSLIDKGYHCEIDITALPSCNLKKNY